MSGEIGPGPEGMGVTGSTGRLASLVKKGRRICDTNGERNSRSSLNLDLLGEEETNCGLTTLYGVYDSRFTIEELLRKKNLRRNLISLVPEREVVREYKNTYEVKAMNNFSIKCNIDKFFGYSRERIS